MSEHKDVRKLYNEGHYGRGTGRNWSDFRSDACEWAGVSREDFDRLADVHQDVNALLDALCDLAHAQLLS